MVSLLNVEHARPYPVAVHPRYVVFTPSIWRSFQAELQTLFSVHFRMQGFASTSGTRDRLSPLVTEAVLLLRVLGACFSEVHLSEVNIASGHDPISRNLPFQPFKELRDIFPVERRRSGCLKR